MAWTAPMTAVANAIWTAAQFNTHVRDNLLETMPGKATANAGAMFITSAANAIVERKFATATTNGSSTRANTAYGDLGDGALPTVTVTTGTRALVCVGAEHGNSGSATGGSLISFAVSSATTIAASDEFAFGENEYQSTSARIIGSRITFLDNLTAGSNVFTAKYRTVSAGTMTCQRRNIAVIPF